MAVCKNGLGFLTLEFEATTVEPKLTVLKTSTNFQSNQIKCNYNSLCVCESSNSIFYGIYPLQIDSQGVSASVIFEKFAKNFNYAAGKSTIAVNQEFVAYLGLKYTIDKDSKLPVGHLSIVLYDIRSPADVYQAVQLIQLQSQVINTTLANPYGYVNLVDLEKQASLGIDPSVNTLLSYNDGGSVWSLVRGDQFVRFDKGFEREVDNKLHFSVMGFNSTSSGLVSYPV